MFSFKPIGTRRVTQIISKNITELILNHGVKPGEKLSTEKMLASQFNVSIATVRETLKGLEASGLIEKRRGKGGGIFITAIKTEPIKFIVGNYLKRLKFSASQLNEVRLTLEPAIIRIAALQRTSHELRLLEMNINFCKQKLSKTQGELRLKDHHAIGGKTVEFHRLIGQLTHNPVFEVTLDFVLDFLSEFRKTQSTPNILVSTRIVEEHEKIFNSIKKANADEAEKQMRLHLKYVETYTQVEDI